MKRNYGDLFLLLLHFRQQLNAQSALKSGLIVFYVFHLVPKLNIFSVVQNTNSV